MKAQVTVVTRMDPELAERLQREAERSGESVSAMLRALVAEALEARERKRKDGEG